MKNSINQKTASSVAIFNFRLFSLLLLTTLLFFTSCQKETLEDLAPDTIKNQETEQVEKITIDEPMKTLDEIKAQKDIAQSRNGEDGDPTDQLEDGGDLGTTTVSTIRIESSDVNEGTEASFISTSSLRCGYRYRDSNRGMLNNIYQWLVYGRYYRFKGGERTYPFSTNRSTTIILRPDSHHSDLDLFVIDRNTGRIVAQSTNEPGRRERVDLRAGNYLLIVDSQYRNREGAYTLSLYCATSSCHSITAHKYSWNDYTFKDNSGKRIAYWKIIRKWDGYTRKVHTSSRRLDVLFSHATQYEVRAVYTNGRYCGKYVNIR